MPEAAADPLSPSCYHLFPEPGIQESQELGPDLFLPRAHARAVVRDGMVVPGKIFSGLRTGP